MREALRGSTVNVEGLYSEIVGELEKRADPRSAEKEMYYHKKVGKGFKAYGISAPEFYEIAKKYRTTFKQLSFNERVELAKRFFRSGYAGQMSFGIALLKLNVEFMKPSDFSVLEMVGHCLNNWGTVDGFSIDVLQPLLLKHTGEMLRLLRKWNRSESLWKRRASVVVFTRNVGTSGRFTNEALELCDNLIWDEEDYVRKGVGWALKDVMRGNKKRVLEYVKELRQKGVSAVITLYAIRDLKGKERESVLNSKPHETQQRKRK
jgi:3-methyladenine DNA glycosylase AlkD